jgi:hypothetical protein
MLVPRGNGPGASVADDPYGVHYPDDLTIPFCFIPDGAPEPTEWLARYPDHIRMPATFIPDPAEPAPPPETPAPLPPAALLGGTAALASGWEEAARELVRMSAPELLAAVAGSFAGVGILLYPSSMGPRELDERRPRGGFVPPPTAPGLPGLVPPPGTDATRADAGLTPVPPTPPLPGFAPTAPGSTALPGRSTEEHGATVLHSLGKPDPGNRRVRRTSKAGA